jgi:hypothetical protein
MTTVKYSGLEMAMRFVSGGGFDAHAYISRETGKIYWVSDESGLEEEVPEDVDDLDLYAEVPGQRDLDLGKPLALKFADRFLPEIYEEVEHLFRRRGAYSRYRDLLIERGKLDEWYAFEQSAIERELIEWAETEGFVVEKDSIETEI